MIGAPTVGHESKLRPSVAEQTMADRLRTSPGRPAALPSARSRACPCTASRRSPRAAGRPSWSARTSAATAPSPSRGWPSWPTSTASRWPSCCPTPRPARPPSRRRGWSSTSSGSGWCPPRRPARWPATPPTIQAQRGDYNGRVLSIRQDDLRTLAVIYDESPSQLAEQFIAWGVLNPEARRALEG